MKKLRLQTRLAAAQGDAAYWKAEADRLRGELRAAGEELTEAKQETERQQEKIAKYSKRFQELNQDLAASQKEAANYLEQIGELTDARKRITELEELLDASATEPDAYARAGTGPSESREEALGASQARITELEGAYAMATSRADKEGERADTEARNSKDAIDHLIAANRKLGAERDKAQQQVETVERREEAKRIELKRQREALKDQLLAVRTCQYTLTYPVGEAPEAVIPLTELTALREELEAYRRKLAGEEPLPPAYPAGGGLLGDNPPATPGEEDAELIEMPRLLALNSALEIELAAVKEKLTTARRERTEAQRDLRVLQMQNDRREHREAEAGGREGIGAETGENEPTLVETDPNRTVATYPLDTPLSEISYTVSPANAEVSVSGSWGSCGSCGSSLSPEAATDTQNALAAAEKGLQANAAEIAALEAQVAQLTGEVKEAKHDRRQGYLTLETQLEDALNLLYRQRRRTEELEELARSRSRENALYQDAMNNRAADVHRLRLELGEFRAQFPGFTPQIDAGEFPEAARLTEGK